MKFENRLSYLTELTELSLLSCDITSVRAMLRLGLGEDTDADGFPEHFWLVSNIASRLARIVASVRRDSKQHNVSKMCEAVYDDAVKIPGYSEAFRRIYDSELINECYEDPVEAQLVCVNYD